MYSSVELDDPDKSCVFVNDKCKALPNDCSESTGSDASECESIVLKQLAKYAVLKTIIANQSQYPLVRLIKLDYHEKYAKILLHQKD